MKFKRLLTFALAATLSFSALIIAIYIRLEISISGFVIRKC